MSRPVLFLKASIPAGARWITVHPNGPGEKGQPVLIEPQADGSAKVIGGAGGALNHLRIRAVRSESDYKADAEKARLEKKQAAVEQRKRDKAAGLLESKKAAHDAVRKQRMAAEQEFVHTVGQAMGWKPDELQFTPPEGVSDAAARKAADRHHRTILQRANQAVEMQRQRLVADADLRSASGLGELPVTTEDPAALSVDDIAPVPAQNGGLSVSHEFGKRAEAAGLTADERRAEAAAAKPMTADERAKAVRRGETAKLVRDELKSIREPDAPSIKPDLVDARQAVEMLKARKKLLALQKKAQAARGEIDKSAVEPKAYVLEYEASPDEDEKIAADVTNDLRTIRTHAFLEEFGKMAAGSEETLGKHLTTGAFNSINSLALATGGRALVDRSVVDVLGIAGAAQVLARRIHTDLPDDADRIADGMQEFHLHHYMEASQQAMTDARDLMDAAKAIEVGEAADGVELRAGQELNARRRHAVADAQRVLGRTAGEMEANAALVVALKQGRTDKPLQVSMGKLSADDAITRARAIGLQRGDYTVDAAGGNTFLNITPAGMDQLAKPIDRADVEQVRRNLDIAAGRQDEDGWLPDGVARRPDLLLDTKPGTAPSLARPFEPGSDLQKSLRDYIGGRAADGDTPADILADIQSADFFQKAGSGYQQALEAVAPLRADGRQRRAEDLGDTFDGYADDFVGREYGGDRSPLNRQALAIDDTTTESLHRALAEHPDGVAAYKQIGELTPQDQRTLRETFYRDIAHESQDAAALRHELETHGQQEPEAEVEDMFGERMANPDHAEWRQRRDELAAKVGAASLDWAKYADTMRGHEKAYEAVQDLIKSRVAKSFSDAHNKLRPGQPVKLGRAVIRQNLNHLDATDPAARAERQARERELIDGLRERQSGRYAAGSVADKLDASREEREAFEQAQMGFFSSEDAPAAAAGEEKPLAGDERHTLGHVAERQIAAIMGQVGANFKPREGFSLGEPTMSGGDAFARQRAIKLIAANKRMGLHLGAGSGKTLVSMAAFTHLHAKGQVKRGLFMVPSIVQGQFGGEALKYLQPGKYRWHCEPGASREERIKGYRDPANHFCVVTHQAFRDDLIHMAAAADGVSENQVRDRLASMTRAERKAWGKTVMDREGINFDFSAVDEGHNLLDRAGKTDSGMSLAVGAVTDNTPYHVSMTADPVRNDDASEVFSALQKIDPDRYTDRAEFMRRYGIDAVAARDGLQREMARYFYAHTIAPPVRADRKTVTAKLSDGQNKALAGLDKDMASMRLARMSGRVDVEAARRVNPGAFDGVPSNQHQAVAKNLQGALGILRESAMNRVINAHPESGKTEALVEQIKARSGKPGMVFAHSVDAVKTIEARLKREGLRVVTITGADSTAEKDRKRKLFRPEDGSEPGADILVASDAASTGLNAQRGQWLMQYDTPMCAMTHAQRNARIHRIGQKNDVELVDIVADHPFERRARDRLAKKYAMRDVMTSSAERLDDTGLAHYLRQRDVADKEQQGLL